MIRMGLIALAMLLAAPAAAHADPITTAIFGAAFASTFAGAVVSFAITTAISAGIGLLKAALTKKPETREPGIQLQVEVGDNVPVGFTMGFTATAGTRRYAGVWGSSGDTPNAYLVDVVQVGDIPAPQSSGNRPGLWVNGERATILWNETPSAQGYPVEEFQDGGKNYLWVKYRDGTETTADSYLLDKFSGDADRPWEAEMVGRGCPHFILTARFNRELFTGQMEYLAEPPKTAWYDIRLDTTEGGSGDHRWDDQATWEPSDNVVVQIYNIIRGVYYDDGDDYREWLFGGQDLPPFRLPAANWMAAANECDALVAKAGGGTEKQFRSGMEIRGDMEPLSVVEELLKACNGRLAEVGGIFKILVGAPGSAVYSFTDDDIIVTESQSYTPFPGLDSTHNAILATYPEPEEAWGIKDAPARYSDALETEDGSRRLPISVGFPAAPYSIQVQRLMKAMIGDERRFRVHSFWLPPASWLLEPAVDVVSWTSARNGYTNKKFLVVRMGGARTKNQLVLLKEIDPADYDWVAGDDEQPTSVGFLGPIRPPPQPMVGWQVEPFTITDGGFSRPSIKVLFDGNQDDVQFVRIQARLEATEEIVFDGTVSYGPPEETTKSVVLNGQFMADTDYEARGIFLPFTGRLTEWSDWLAVTTPNVGISEGELDGFLTGLFQQLKVGAEASLSRALEDLRTEIESLAQLNNGAWALTDVNINRIVSTVGQRIGVAEASVTIVQEAVATVTQALARYFVNLTATNSGGEAVALLHLTAIAGDEETGSVAGAEIAVRAGADGEMAEAAIELMAVNDPVLGRLVSRFRVKAELADIVFANGARLNLQLVPQTNGDKEAPIDEDGDIIADLLHRDRSHHTLLDGPATVRFPIHSPGVWDYIHSFEQDETGEWPVTFDPTVFVGEPPVIDDAADSETTVQIFIRSLSPPRAIATLIGGGGTEAGSTRQFTISPPVAGRSVIDLDIEDLDDIPVGTYIITPIGEYLDATFDLQGPGGSSAGTRAEGGSSVAAGAGTATTFDWGGGTMTAGAGGVSATVTTLAESGSGGNQNSGGSAGTASGGDTNTNGSSGFAGGQLTVSGVNYGVAGGSPASPSGSASLGSDILSADDGPRPQKKNGVVGNAPGGGARGGGWYAYDPSGSTSFRWGNGSGGGGTGARCIKEFGTGVLLEGVEYTLIVGDSGAAGTTSGGFTHARTQGARGAAGKAHIF